MRSITIGYGPDFHKGQEQRGRAAIPSNPLGTCCSTDVVRRVDSRSHHKNGKGVLKVEENVASLTVASLL